jgi:hypothetical protein
MNIAATVAGWMLGGVASAYRDRLTSRPRDRVDMQDVPQCRMAIVLLARDGSAVSRTIDDMTGKRGFSHVYLDPCRANAAGERMVVGYTAARGVHWEREADNKPERGRARIELEPEVAREVWGCVRSRLGQPMNVTALVLGMDHRATCVGLIVACLPWEMQSQLHALKVGPCVSPNTIAEYFGVHK